VSKEWILNIATNRWGLNKKSKVGPVSEWIRECKPKSLEEWKLFYFDKIKKEILEPNGNTQNAHEYIKDLGQRLYVKITEVMQAELKEITEEDCILYIEDLVLKKTFDGYLTEIDTIHEKIQLELKHLDVAIKPAPDEWDRKYNVDFYVDVSGSYIGIQIKPITYQQSQQIYKWKELMNKSHERFREKFGGKVFIVFSIKNNDKKEIFNPEVVEEIKNEVERLKNLKIDEITKGE